MRPDDLILHWRFRVHRMQHAHYESARRFGHLHLWLGLPVIILSTIVGTSVFATIQKTSQQSTSAWLPIVVGLLSVLSAVLASLQTFLRYSELAEKHRIAGARFANLKHEIELLDSTRPPDATELRQALATIEQRWAKLREESPSVPRKVWAFAEQTLTYEEHSRRYAPTTSERNG